MAGVTWAFWAEAGVEAIETARANAAGNCECLLTAMAGLIEHIFGDSTPKFHAKPEHPREWPGDFPRISVAQSCPGTLMSLSRWNFSRHNRR